ncbi:DNA polymerase III subunit delta [Desertibacillus haloalkaliphilus]|uniref:DNA polymerase III subunit delta n=1 Tax=Desertibacillus haloalkaliphilus TaxID=1328930 RepID=UPI001C257D10|nr:DNA polymerase III subunit delta [Desertibacillus haloalkaliphilus]MBU8905623.1 DNA polymerase III subunit delta [Desertibacillus haloalkaliphilus]
MSYLDIKRKVNNNQIGPLYLFYGTETFLIEDIVQTIIGKVLTPDEHDFNLSVFEMKETAVDVAVEDAQTLPFMGNRRIVLVKEAYFLTANKEKEKIEHDLKRLEEYITNPVAETVFIIIAPYEKLDERKKIVKTLKKQGEVLHAVDFDEAMMKRWLEERAKQSEVVIAEDAKEHLMQLLGGKLMLISMEMEKLALYVGKEGTITKETVDRLVARTFEQDVFALVDHVVHERIDQGLRIFYDLLKQNEDPIKLLALLVRQFRIIYQVKELTRRGYSQKQMAGQLKLHPYAVKLAAGQARRFDDATLMRILSDLADADYKIKSGKMDKTLALELFLTTFKQKKQLEQ